MLFQFLRSKTIRIVGSCCSMHCSNFLFFLYTFTLCMLTSLEKFSIYAKKYDKVYMLWEVFLWQSQNRSSSTKTIVVLHQMPHFLFNPCIGVFDFCARSWYELVMLVAGLKLYFANDILRFTPSGKFGCLKDSGRPWNEGVYANVYLL